MQILNLVNVFLTLLARLLLFSQSPKIIGVTGSVGKTTTRRAIAAVLSGKYAVRQPKRNYNNETGLPFAILGQTSPGYNPLSWLKLLTSFVLEFLHLKSFPKVLVLEYGIDRPGDMTKLIKIARPNLTVLTPITNAHFEFFENEQALWHEKGDLAACLEENETLVFSLDNEASVNQSSRHKGKNSTFTFLNNPNASFKARFDTKWQSNHEVQSTLSLTFQGGETELKGSWIGFPNASALATAYIVAKEMGLSDSEIQNSVKHFKNEPSRLSLLNGKNSSTILDDSYNASPFSMIQALEVVRNAPHKHKVLLLGEMRELGSLSETEHSSLGEKISSMFQGCKVILVGEKTKYTEEAIRKNSESITVTRVASIKDVNLNDINPTEETIFLVKGSQGTRMELLVVQLLDDIKQRGQVCRQYGDWLKDYQHNTA